jgi:hypothetical protein
VEVLGGIEGECAVLIWWKDLGEEVLDFMCACLFDGFIGMIDFSSSFLATIHHR